MTLGFRNRSKGRARARPRLWSVFSCQHDRQNPQGLGRVARIVAAHVVAGSETGPVVVVDLPENLAPVMLEAAEVVFAVWVVIEGEAVESLHSLTNCAPVGGW